jgi:hypothetical protein
VLTTRPGLLLGTVAKAAANDRAFLFEGAPAVKAAGRGQRRHVREMKR